MMSIYQCQANVKQVSIDTLPYRKGVNREFKYYDKNLSSKCKHIHLLDYHDKAKVLTTMSMRKRKHCVNQVPTKMYTVMSTDGKYIAKVKESHLMDTCKKLASKGITYIVK